MPVIYKQFSLLIGPNDIVCYDVTQIPTFCSTNRHWSDKGVGNMSIKFLCDCTVTCCVQGVLSHCLHPGCVRSELLRDLPWYLVPLDVLIEALLFKVYVCYHSRCAQAFKALLAFYILSLRTYPSLQKLQM